MERINYRSATSNKELMAQARQALKGNWGLAYAGAAIFFLINIILAFVPVAGVLMSIIITGPLTVCMNRFFMLISRNEAPSLGQYFASFSFAAIGSSILSTLFILGCTLLLIIPGIIASLACAMMYFILADDETAGAMGAIKRSIMMMGGNKWKLSCLFGRFIWWFLLSLLPLVGAFVWKGMPTAENQDPIYTFALNIGWFLITPYLTMSLVKFYEDLKPQAPLEAPVTPSVS